MPGNNSDEVGYRTPPKHTRFRKGVSGNPRGRPRGRPNLATLLERVLQEKITVTKGGKRQTVSKIEAALTALSDKAARGDISAIRHLLPWAASIDSQTANVQDRLSDSDLKLINRVAERLRRSEKGAGDEKNK